MTRSIARRSGSGGSKGPCSVSAFLVAGRFFLAMGRSFPGIGIVAHFTLWTANGWQSVAVYRH